MGGIRATSSPLQSSGSASTLTYCWLIAIAVSSARAVTRSNENFSANACASLGGAAERIYASITCRRSDVLDPLERVMTHRSVFASSRADANRRTVTCGEGTSHRDGSCRRRRWNMHGQWVLSHAGRRTAAPRVKFQSAHRAKLAELSCHQLHGHFLADCFWIFWAPHAAPA